MGAGRARISDFGLARTAAMGEDIERTSEDDGLLLAAPLTRTGALLGTPAYMAPEQIRGEPATAASDQFAFGVVLYEALVGHRPFLGNSIGALLEAIEAGKIVAPVRKLPSALMAVIRRALTPEPARRYPDMPALLTALRGARDLRWRPWVRTAALAGGATAALLGSGMLAYMSSVPPGAACASIEELWNDDRRAQVADVLADHGGAEVVAAIEDYATALQRQQTERCAAGAEVSQWSDTCLADRRTALADLVEAIVAAPVELRPGVRPAVDMLPALVDCAEAPKYDALVSEAAPDIRARVWQQRLAIAPMFQPRAVSRPLQALPIPGESGLVSDTEREALLDRRTVLESRFARAVRVMNPRRAPQTPDESLTLVEGLFDRLGFKSEPDRAIDPIPWLLQLGADTTGAGYADLAARTWVLAAEGLETRPHTARQHRQLWTEADQALARLPRGSALQSTLRRDLAYVQLMHARHVTTAGACSGAGADLAACEPLFAATKALDIIAAGATATAVDHELLARAHEHAGDVMAAGQARGGAAPLVLDERALGYLDPSAAPIVPDGPTAEESIHCDLAGTVCTIDRGYAVELLRAADTLFSGIRQMPSVKDGLYRGHKLYGIRPGAPIKLLGFKNGDMITGINGSPVVETSFLAEVKDLLARGGLTLEFERKGVLQSVRISIPQ